MTRVWNLGDPPTASNKANELAMASLYGAAIRGGDSMLAKRLTRQAASNYAETTSDPADFRRAVAEAAGERWVFSA